MGVIMSIQQRSYIMLTYQDFKQIMRLSPVTKKGRCLNNSSGAFVCSCLAANDEVSILYWGTSCALVWEDGQPSPVESLKQAMDIVTYHHAMNS